MASLLSSRLSSRLPSRRIRGEIELAATEPTVVIGAEDSPGMPRAAWLILAAGAGLLSALGGWVLVTGLTVAGWLAAEPGTLGQALGVGTQLWLLANGGGATIGSTSLTLTPWGATLLLGWMVSRTAGYAARYGSPASPSATPLICVVTTVAYLTPLLVVALLAGGPMSALRAGSTMLVVVGVAAAWGCARARSDHPTSWWPTSWWPAWSRAVPRAVGAALLLMFAGGAAVLVTGLVANRDRVTALVESLDAGVIGNIVLLLGQLAYAPNVVVWAASYALGAGFSLGGDTIVSPAVTELGVLPPIPMLAAVPDVGPGGASHLWWLALGIAAGAMAATLVVISRPTARLDETGLVGGLSGVLAGIAFTGIAWLSGGDLGTGLLTGLGPPLMPVLVMATTTMGLSGAVCGVLLGLRRGRPAPAEADDEPTQPIR